MFEMPEDTLNMDLLPEQPQGALAGQLGLAEDLLDMPPSSPRADDPVEQDLPNHNPLTEVICSSQAFFAFYRKHGLGCQIPRSPTICQYDLSLSDLAIGGFTRHSRASTDPAEQAQQSLALALWPIAPSCMLSIGILECSKLPGEQLHAEA